MYTTPMDVKSEKTHVRRQKFGTFLRSDDPSVSTDQEDNTNHNGNRTSNASVDDMTTITTTNSPYIMSPWNQSSSPYTKSPWTQSSPTMLNISTHQDGLMGSLVREEGHIYSLAVSDGFLYTGSDSKNIRVWKDFKDFSCFKSHSGLVKSIIVSGNKIFTGHQDGNVRVWRQQKSGFKRVGTLPTVRDFIKSSIRPKNYVRVRHHRNVPWIKHFDAVSCMSLDDVEGILYTGSWDKTVKVWRISDSKCLESVNAHDDAVNAVAVAGFGGLVVTGSADGMVKVWRRDERRSKLCIVQVLLDGESAVTAVAASGDVVYCGASDGLVRFWMRGKNGLLATAGGGTGVLRGHKMAVLCLAVAGNLVVSGSADKSICVWRRRDGVGESGVHECLCVLTGQGGPVKCVAVEEDEESDGRSIVYSGSLDRSVMVWRVSEDVHDMKLLKG